MGSWYYWPNANFSGWLKFYINDVYFNTSEADWLPGIFGFGFIYPISVINDETLNFFEVYSNSIEAWEELTLMGGHSWKLGSDYFEAKLNQPLSQFVFSLYYFRRYNIHTGVLSKFVEEFEIPSNTKYKIEIVNPADEGTATSIIIPIVSLVAIGMIYQRKRRKIRNS